MVPAYIEELPIIPMSSSHKADRKNLPPPKGQRVSSGSANVVAPRDETEAALSRALTDVMKIERVSIEDNFFQDLGAHSLLMARFCSEIRKSLKSDVSMRDIYLNPTIAKLASHLLTSHLAAQTDEAATVATKQLPARTPSDLEYYGCGALQLLYYAAYGLFGVWLLTTGFEWTAAIDTTAEAYRARMFAVAFFVALNAISIAAKWLLIGRWKEEVIPDLSLRYFRFWLVKDHPRRRWRCSSQPDLQRLFAAARRQGRPQQVIQSAPAGVHRPDLDRKQHDPAQRAVAVGYKAQANYTIPTDPHRRQRVRRRGERADIDTGMEDGAQLATRRRCRRPTRPARQALSRLARAGDDGELLHRRSTRLHAAAARALLRLPTLCHLRGRSADRDPAAVSPVPLSLSHHQRGPAGA